MTLRKLQFKRYANNVIANTTGAAGELIVNTGNYSLTVHDGTTSGGHQLALQSFAQSAFDAANTGGGGTNYTNANVALYLPNYDGVINAYQIKSDSSYVNIVSQYGFQLQYDPTGVYNLYDIANGNWLYLDGSGLVWQSNTTGNTYTVYFDNIGNVVADGNVTASNIVSANLILSDNNIINYDGYSLGIQSNTGVEIRRVEGSNATYIGVEGGDSYVVAEDGTNRMVVDVNPTEAIIQNFDGSQYTTWTFKSNGTIIFPDSTLQNTAFTGTVVGPTGPTGPQGPSGPTGPTGVTTDIGQFAQANAAFAAANSASNLIPQNATSVSYTLQLTDAGKHIYSTNTSTQVITLPNNGNTSWNVGSTVMLVLKGTGTMNVIPQTGISLYLANNSTAKSYVTVYSYGMATLLNVAANTWFINGAGVV